MFDVDSGGVMERVNFLTMNAHDPTLGLVLLKMLPYEGCFAFRMTPNFQFHFESRFFGSVFLKFQ